MAVPRSMWDLSSLTRDRTCTTCVGTWSLNHRTTKEVPHLLKLNNFFLLFPTSDDLVGKDGGPAKKEKESIVSYDTAVK